MMDVHQQHRDSGPQSNGESSFDCHESCSLGLMYVDMVDPRRYNSLSSKYSRVFVLACRQFLYAFFFNPRLVIILVD